MFYHHRIKIVMTLLSRMPTNLRSSLYPRLYMPITVYITEGPYMFVLHPPIFYWLLNWWVCRTHRFPPAWWTAGWCTPSAPPSTGTSPPALDPATRLPRQTVVFLALGSPFILQRLELWAWMEGGKRDAIWCCSVHMVLSLWGSTVRGIADRMISLLYC